MKPIILKFEKNWENAICVLADQLIYHLTKQKHIR
jgi:hypothetical protein